MSPFMQYLKNRSLQEGLFPNMGGQGVKPPAQPGAQQPAQPGAQQPAQPGAQITPASLDKFGSQVSDYNWHSLSDVFDRYYQKNPTDPTVVALGSALLKAATSSNMSGLQPFAQKYLQAQR